MSEKEPGNLKGIGRGMIGGYVESTLGKENADLELKPFNERDEDEQTLVWDKLFDLVAERRRLSQGGDRESGGNIEKDEGRESETAERKFTMVSLPGDESFMAVPTTDYETDVQGRAGQ
jgi:hypothetical protein